MREISVRLNYGPRLWMEVMRERGIRKINYSPTKQSKCNVLS